MSSSLLSLYHCRHCPIVEAFLPPCLLLFFSSLYSSSSIKLIPMSSISPEANSTRASLLQPLPTPRWGLKTGFGAFSVRASATIHADANTILDCLLETSSYPLWNGFVPRVTIPPFATSDLSTQETRLSLGCQFIEHVDMYGNGRPSGLIKMKLLMTTMEELEHDTGRGYKVVWLGQGYPDWALRSERVHIISRNQDGTCAYEVWETFSGPLAILVKLFVGKVLVKRFEQWNQDLKTHVQGMFHTPKK